MNISHKFLILFSLLMIGFNLSCSSTQQNTINQDLGLTKVEPITPIDQNIESTEKTFFQYPLSANDPHIKRTEIKDKLMDEDIFQNRDLSLYEKENTLNCHTYACKETKLRNFIWTHWKDKKRGYISSNWTGIDLSVTEHFFIEPNEEGKWAIVWRLENNQIDNNYLEDYLDIISAQKIETDKNRWKLVLNNVNGEVIRTF